MARAATPTLAGRRWPQALLLAILSGAAIAAAVETFRLLANFGLAPWRGLLSGREADFATFAHHARRAAIVALILGAAAQLGALLLRRWRRAAPPAPLRELTVVAVGLGALSLLLSGAAAMGALGAIKAPAFQAVFVAFGALGLFRGWWEARAGGGRNGEARERSWVAAAWAFGGALVGLTVAALALTPPVEIDELFYHLMMAKRYLRAGGFVEIPSNFASYWPHQTALLFSLALGLGDDLTARLLHAAHLLLVGWTIYALVARDKAGRRTGLAAAIAFASLPLVIKTAASTYVDLALTLFALLAAHRALCYLEDGRISDFYLGCLLGGMAAATKWQGGNACFTVMLAFGWRWAAERFPQWRRHLGQAVLGGLLCCLPVAPLLVRNLLWTGNPLYPFLDSVFHSGAWAAGAYESWRIINAPAFQGWRAFLFPSLGLLPLAVAPLAAAGALVDRRARRCFVLALFYLALSIAEYFQDRYLLPVFALLTVAAGYAAAQGALGRLGRLLFPAVAALALVLNLATILATHANRFPVFFRQEFRDQYLRISLPHYEAIQWVNQRAQPGERYLHMFLPEMYYLDFDWINGYAMTSRVIDYPAIATVDGLLARLQELGVTHVVVTSFYRELPGYGRRVRAALSQPDAAPTYDDAVYQNVRRLIDSGRLEPQFLDAGRSTAVLRVRYPDAASPGQN